MQPKLGNEGKMNLKKYLKIDNYYKIKNYNNSFFFKSKSSLVNNPLSYKSAYFISSSMNKTYEFYDMDFIWMGY